MHVCHAFTEKHLNYSTIQPCFCHYSLVVRASASGAVGRGFAPRSGHNKGIKNGTSSSLADVRIKRVVLGR